MTAFSKESHKLRKRYYIYQHTLTSLSSPKVASSLFRTQQKRWFDNLNKENKKISEKAKRVISSVSARKHMSEFNLHEKFKYNLLRVKYPHK